MEFLNLSIETSSMSVNLLRASSLIKLEDLDNFTALLLIPTRGNKSKRAPASETVAVTKAKLLAVTEVPSLSIKLGR